jgi:hypothetical protein
LAVSGNLAIGTNSASNKLYVSSTASYAAEFYRNDNNDSRINLTNTTTTSGGDKGLMLGQIGVESFVYNYANGNLIFGTNATTRLTIASTGAATFTSSVTATSFFESSDSRLKILVKDYHQPKGIENVTARMYVKNNKKELGYFAQDLKEILPSAVTEGDDGFLNLSYSQVHTAKIAYLEAEVAELKELIKKLL